MCPDNSFYCSEVSLLESAWSHFQVGWKKPGTAFDQGPGKMKIGIYSDHIMVTRRKYEIFVICEIMIIIMNTAGGATYV